MAIETGLTLLEMKERLAQYLAAEVAILKSQSYTIKDRTFERANLREVRQAIKDLQNQIKLKERGGKRVRKILPRDQ